MNEHDQGYVSGHADGYKEGLRDAGYSPRETIVAFIVGLALGALVTWIA